jgi:hypothetical protein
MFGFRPKRDVRLVVTLFQKMFAGDQPCANADRHFDGPPSGR